MKRKLLIVLMALAMLFSLIPVANAYGNNDFSVPLYAGQNILVGDVYVTNDEDNLYIDYVLNDDTIREGWVLTELHLAVEQNVADIPQNKNNNPIPGHFEFKKVFDYTDSATNESFTVPIPEGMECGDTMIIAAHAEIEKHDCVTNATAPYGGTRVVDSEQGKRYDGNAVKTVRSNPESTLVLEPNLSESNFYSLGFQELDENSEPTTAYIVIEFENPIVDGTGPDIQIVEDTWGLPYPRECAKIYVSSDNENWQYLGEADNQSLTNYNSVTDFDLKEIGLASARYIKVQDNSTKSDFSNLSPSQDASLDGFDLNAVLALHDSITCNVDTEGVWGEGTRFTEKGDWGMYFEYVISCNDSSEEDCKTETAWVGDSIGEGSSWWYYFKTTKDTSVSKPIWAGQTNDAGDVIVEPLEGGKVKFTIELNDGWKLQECDDTVKIQEYSTIPDTRPSAGLFTTYKGNELVVTVDYSDYYAIHLDVQYCQAE